MTRSIVESFFIVALTIIVIGLTIAFPLPMIGLFVFLYVID